MPRTATIFAHIRHRVNATSVTGALRGFFGDRLPKQWRGKMCFAEAGRQLDGVPLVTRQHAVVFVHGSADTELGWQSAPGELDFGKKLLLDFGVQPLYVRYNSGLAIHQNGGELSRLLAELTQKNKFLRRLTLIGHSMGGLVIHSAVFDARARGLPWAKKVRQVFLLGTPHAGAPLAKLAEKTEQLLQFIPNPITLVGASVIGIRSQGLKDLSQGQKAIALNDPVLLPHADYVFIAGGVSSKPGGILSRLFGDGMVRHASALPAPEQPSSHWISLLRRIARRRHVHIETVAGVGHFALRHSPAVYRILAARWR
jgi:pimeloyl-ACP methyl ester carboxylesterase